MSLCVNASAAEPSDVPFMGEHPPGIVIDVLPGHIAIES